MKIFFIYHSSISCSLGMLWLKGFIKNSFMRLSCSLRNLMHIKTNKTWGISSRDLARPLKHLKRIPEQTCVCIIRTGYTALRAQVPAELALVLAALPLPHSCPPDRVYLPPPSHPWEEAWPYVLLSKASPMAIMALIPKWSCFHAFGGVTQVYSTV